MAQRDARAVGVDLGRVEIELFYDGASLRRERLVRLDDVEVLHLQAGSFEGASRRRHGADAHDPGFDTRVRVGHQSRHRLQSLGPQGVGAGEHHRSGSVVEAGGIARSDRSPSFLNTGFNRASLSRVVSGFTCSSTSKLVLPWGAPIYTGTIWPYQDGVITVILPKTESIPSRHLIVHVPAPGGKTDVCPAH